jgi:hypothetical protein
MTTEKQIEANRQNALLSTGAKTPEGKAIVSKNALKHGILSKETLIKGEDEQELIELGKRLRMELTPQGELEFLFVDRIVSSYWRLRRAIKIEAEMIKQKEYSMFGSAKGLGNIFIEDYSDYDCFLKHLRYETTLERQIYRALHELIRLQMARKGEKPPAPLAVDVDITGDTKNGFVS